MQRKCLVIIPLSKVRYRYGFSAPLGYLFSGHTDVVHGVFSNDLTRELVRSFEFFIVELNWVTELYEFHLIVHFIRKHNPAGRILFGGLFSQMHFERIFQVLPVDFFIRGDNEVPIQQFLDGRPCEEIPNMVSRDFRNELTYRFTSEDYRTLDFSIEWFPGYMQILSGALALHKPRYPGETSEECRAGECTRDELFYSFPLIITTKKCSVAHAGCDYCMGSKDLLFQNPAAMDRHSLQNVLRKLEMKSGPVYRRASIYILGDILKYDPGDAVFDLEAFIEYDGPLAGNGRIEALRKLLHAFAGGVCRIPASSFGIHDRRRDLEYRTVLACLATPNHEIKIMLYEEDKSSAKRLGIPEQNAEYTLDNFDLRGQMTFERYQSYSEALQMSIALFTGTRINEQFNLRSVLEDS